MFKTRKQLSIHPVGLLFSCSRSLWKQRRPPLSPPPLFWVTILAPAPSIHTGRGGGGDDDVGRGGKKHTLGGHCGGGSPPPYNGGGGSLVRRDGFLLLGFGRTSTCSLCARTECIYVYCTTNGGHPRWK